MKNHFIMGCAIMFIFSSCQKSVDNFLSNPSKDLYPIPTLIGTTYTIFQGQQYSDKNTYLPVNLTELKFKVKFDSSAIYQTVASYNQGDINKLYGFSDNNLAHHNYSARFGRRWYNNALEIFAYNYNNSIVSFKKIGNATIGVDEMYDIKIVNDTYIFTFGETTLKLPRLSTTTTGIGYKLYPYFGGTETAPHDIKIWIEEL
ncbi:MAG: hypothetical protein V9E96_19520 [Chitinophagaceae bacterium]|jgi:hypothetical protein